ncbi:unnamed protein product [Urochloa humidicola]
MVKSFEVSELPVMLNTYFHMKLEPTCWLDAWISYLFRSVQAMDCISVPSMARALY